MANCICPHCKSYLSKLQKIFVQNRKGERASSNPLPSNFHLANISNGISPNFIFPNCKSYFYKWQIVFVHFANIICPNRQIYLSRLGKESEPPLTLCHQTFMWPFILLRSCPPTLNPHWLQGFLKKDFVHEIQHNFCISVNNNTLIRSNCQNTQFLLPVTTILISKTPILLKRDELYSVYNFWKLWPRDFWK